MIRAPGAHTASYAHQVSAAIAAGGLQRGYLRGVAIAKTCAATSAKLA